MRPITLALPARTEPRAGHPSDAPPARGALLARDAGAPRDADTRAAAPRDADTRAAAPRALAAAPPARAAPVAAVGAARPAAGPRAAASPGRARPPGTFKGALLPICGVEVLVVLVRPWILADLHGANLFVVAFQERFRRTIVLVAWRDDGVPGYYGPAEIVRVLRALPPELIPWRRLLLRAEPPAWRLPLPPPRTDAPDTTPLDTADLITEVLPIHPRPTAR